MGTNHEALPELTEAEASSLLQIHCGTWPDADDPRPESGLLFSLRAWNGEPNVAAFHEVMACIRVLGPAFSKEMIPSREISDLWGLVYLGSSYVNDQGRMEHRRELVAPSDVADTELRWLDCIGYAVMIFLQADHPQEALMLYDAYLAEQ